MSGAFTRWRAFRRLHEAGALVNNVQVEDFKGTDDGENGEMGSGY